MALRRPKPEAGHKPGSNASRWQHRPEQKLAANKVRRSEDRRAALEGRHDH